jgi:hypothetical protein
MDDEINSRKTRGTNTFYSKHYDFDNLTKRIFQRDKSEAYTTLFDEIEYFPTLLTNMIDADDPKKIETLNFLKFLLEKNMNNSEIMKSTSIKINNEMVSFPILLLKLYISTENNEIINLVKDVFEMMINNANIDASNYEFISQHLSKSFRDNTFTLNEKVLNKYLEILKVLYGERLNPSKPKNYFYFSGSGSIRVNQKRLEDDKIKINNVKILFLFRLDASFQYGSKSKSFLTTQPETSLIYS